MGHRPGRGAGARHQPDGRVASPLLILLLLPLALGLGALWASGALGLGLWWLTNTMPPTLTLDGPADVVRGTVTVQARLEPADRARVVDARVDGRPLAISDQIPLDTSGLPDGEHQIVVVAEDTSWRRNQASATMTVRSDNTPPRLTIQAQPDRVTTGHTWVLRVQTDEPAAIEARLGERPLDIQVGSGFGWAMVGFPPDAAAASLPLLVEGADRVGNRSEVRQRVEVAPGQFPKDEVEVSAALLPLLGRDVRADEDRRLAPTYAGISQPKRWEGRLLVPVQGPIITHFGEERSYNGGPSVGHHAGVDIAAPMGQPALAPAAGTVVLVDEVRLRGKVVVLDHGLGVFTTYGHLSEVDVRVGQTVERGQAFAKVGSTGLSTGPHLHWELWVRGANVDPMEWTQRDLP